MGKILANTKAVREENIRLKNLFILKQFSHNFFPWNFEILPSEKVKMYKVEKSSIMSIYSYP